MKQTFNVGDKVRGEYDGEVYESTIKRITDDTIYLERWGGYWQCRKKDGAWMSSCNDGKPLELITFEDKSAEEQGIDVSRYFTVIEENDYFYEGDVAKFVGIESDCTGGRCPRFKNMKNEKEHFIHWKCLRYATQSEIDAVVIPEESKPEIYRGLDGKIKLTHSQFLEHIKQHGPTKARITEPAVGYEVGVSYEFVVAKSGMVHSTWVGFYINPSYTGLFELVEEEKKTAMEISHDSPYDADTYFEKRDIKFWKTYNPILEEAIMGYKQPVKNNLSLKEKIMNSITSYIKNATLSADEKLLRENGLKDECGNYTNSYEDVRDFLLNQEYEAKVVEQLKAKVEAEKKEK